MRQGGEATRERGEQGERQYERERSHDKEEVCVRERERQRK